MTFERITVDPEVMGGVPCVRGLRIPVATLLVMIADGMTPDEVVAELPDLTKENVSEALHFAAEAVREREPRTERERGHRTAAAAEQAVFHQSSVKSPNAPALSTAH